MPDRFDDQGGMAGVEPDAVDKFLAGWCPDYDELPNPEDYAIDKELEFVGYYLMVSAAHKQLADAVDTASKENFVLDFTLKKEGILEKWLDNAQCFLPEWALIWIFPTLLK